MNLKNKTTFIKKTLAGLCLAFCFSTAQAKTTVVEIVNFACQYCAYMNNMIPDIESKLAERNIDLVVAPIFTEENIEPYIAYTYYAIRKRNPELLQAVRVYLFKGASQDGILFQSVEQTIAYFEQFSPYYADLQFKTDIQSLADTDEVRKSYKKGIYLAIKGGVDELPAFLIIEDNEIKKVIARNSVSKSLAEVKERLLDYIVSNNIQNKTVE